MIQDFLIYLFSFFLNNHKVKKEYITYNMLIKKHEKIIRIKSVSVKLLGFKSIEKKLKLKVSLEIFKFLVVSKTV